MATKKKGKSTSPRSPTIALPTVAAAAANLGTSDPCSQPSRKQVRFASETTDATRLGKDDFLHAFGGDIGNVLHIDHAHMIAIGEKGERYYLMMVVDGVDFMWATPSRHTSTPELVIEDFLRNSGVSINKIRCDDATVSRSDTFKLWCCSRNITICATAGYNHTMQAQSEGAIRIAKEHVRCMLKTAGMPFKFWPWALTQFCRIYNYWPKKGHSPLWIMLKNHRFCQRLSRELHPFGCYVIGHLPREHPDVRDTTHSDRGVEGEFLGWDLHTPTVWLWSFRRKKAVRIMCSTTPNSPSEPPLCCSIVI